MSIFERYQRKQEKLMADHAETQARIQKMLEESEKEKQKLYNLLEERKVFFRKNFVIIGSLIILITGGLFFIIVRLKKVRQVSEETKEESRQEAEVKSEEGEGLSEYERKIKKLEIIETELVGKNPYEKQVALSMLEQFLKDDDYRIKLRVIEIMHEINSETSVNILERIIKQENTEYKIAACKLLGELKSSHSIELLVKLMDTDDDEIKGIVISSATRVLNNKVADDELMAKIKSKLDEKYAQDNLIG